VDNGLLILWTAGGLLLVGHGTQKLFGWLGSAALDGREAVDPQTAVVAPAPEALAPSPPIVLTEPVPEPVRHVTRASWLVPVFLCVSDALALSAALVLTGAYTSALGLAYVAASVASIAAADGYRSRITLSALQATPWLLGRLAIPLLVVTPAALLTGTNPTVFALVTTAMVLVAVGRALSYAVVRRARRSSHLLEGAVILGAGEIGVELAQIFDDHPEYGVQPLGFLDCVDDELPLPLLGDVDSLDALLARGDIHRVIVAFGPSREADLVDVLRTAVQHNVEFHVVPRFFDVGVPTAGQDSDDVRGIPLRRIAMRLKAAGLKRAVDIVVASTLLAVTAPVLAVVALSVRWTSPGPVFFAQERVGRGGRIFKMLKFRTMVDGAAAQLDRVRHLNERDGVVFKIRDDPRCTAVGRWLRRFSIDELPQLWHVLTGDMTLVGPRPAVPAEVARYDDDARWRLLVKPGLTGLWQVSGRSDLAWAESLRLDLYYIYNWSPSLDLAILGRTLSAVLRRQGAY
jgi:exopolysaccharide biosynthesis polyprenyl glycosylphosphotransferase